MNYQELIREENKLLSKMTTAQLSKKEEVDINNLLNKIGKLKIENSKKSTDKKDTEFAEK